MLSEEACWNTLSLQGELSWQGLTVSLPASAGCWVTVATQEGLLTEGFSPDGDRGTPWCAGQLPRPRC